jgi:hypothetical protein
MDNENKQKVVEGFLNKGKTTVAVLADYPHVEIPEFVKKSQFFPKRAVVILNLSYRFPGNMETNSHGILADLTFDSGLYTVEIPWGSIMSVNEEGGNIVFLGEGPRDEQWPVKAKLGIV